MPQNPPHLPVQEVAGGDGGEHADELEREAELEEVAEGVAAGAGDHHVRLVFGRYTCWGLQ